MYPSFACQGSGKNLGSHIQHPEAIIDIWELSKKITHGQSSWWNVKVHHFSFILKKMKLKHNPTNVNP
jgi:hypothetical protein